MKISNIQTIVRLSILFRHLVLSVGLVAQSFDQAREITPINIDIPCESHTIKGLFYPGETNNGTYTAILLHGFPSELGDLFGLGESLSRAGVHALTFTYSGIRPSEGINTYAGALRDIRAVILYLGQSEIMKQYNIDTSRIILIGHCYGGSMALNYATVNPEIRRIIALEPAEPGEFSRQYLNNNKLAAALDSIFDALMQPNGPVNFQGKEDLRKQVQDPIQYDLVLNATEIADRDILLVTGWDDYITKTEGHHIPIYRALKKAGAVNVEFVAFQTNHGFTNIQKDLATEVIKWILSE
jgi:pimeloyl-ACP methyl ester carboxylesterase